MPYIIGIVVGFGLLHILVNSLLLIPTPEKEKEEMKKKMTEGLQKGIVVVATLLIISHLWGIGKEMLISTVVCQNATANETRRCLLNTEWSSPIMSADGPVSNGMQLCATRGGLTERTERDGTAFWRFRTEEGRLMKEYRLYPG